MKSPIKSKKSTLWSNLKKNFEKKPGVFTIDDNDLQSLMNYDFFSVVVKYCDDHIAKVKNRNYVRLYIDNKLVGLNQSSRFLLPLNEDQDFNSYYKRIKIILKKSNFSLIIGDFYSCDWNLFLKILTIAKKINKTVGNSHQRIDFQIFIGDYKRTPGGVHHDNLSAFHIPLIGTKKMRFWSSQFTRENSSIKNNLNYKKFLKHSILLSAQKNNLIYWPSDLWHTGESNGDFGVTISFGWWTETLGVPELKSYFSKIDQVFNKKTLHSRSQNALDQNFINNLSVIKMKLISSEGLWGTPSRQFPKNVIASFKKSKIIPFYFYEKQKQNLIICNGQIIKINNKKLFLDFKKLSSKSRMNTKSLSPSARSILNKIYALGGLEINN